MVTEQAGELPGKENGLAKAAVAAGGVPAGYNEIEVDFYQFQNEGDAISGRLVEKREVNMRGGRIGRYTLIGKDNRKVCFLGSVQLDELLRSVATGTEVYVQYTHKEKTGGEFEMKHFKVFTKAQHYGA